MKVLLLFMIATLLAARAFFGLYPHCVGVLAVTFPYQGWIFHQLKGRDWVRAFLKFARKDDSDWDPKQPLS